MTYKRAPEKKSNKQHNERQEKRNFSVHSIYENNNRRPNQKRLVSWLRNETEKPFSLT